MGFSEHIDNRGYYQKGMYSILNSIVTNMNACMVKLDADATVNDTNFNALLAITTPTIGSTYGKTVQPNAMKLSDIVALCKAIRASFNALMDKLAADSGVNGTTAFTSLKFSTTGDLVDVPNAKMKKLGANQGAIGAFLDDFVTKWGAALAVLDGDSGVADTDYFTLEDVLDVVDASSSSSSSSCRSSSSSSCSSSSCSSSSSKSSSSCSSSSSKSSSSSSRSSSSSSSSSSCRSSSSSSSCSSSSSRSSSSSSSSSRSSSSSSCSSSSSKSSSSSSCSSSSCSSSSSSSNLVNLP